MEKIEKIGIMDKNLNNEQKLKKWTKIEIMDKNELKIKKGQNRKMVKLK